MPHASLGLVSGAYHSTYRTSAVHAIHLAIVPLEVCHSASLYGPAGGHGDGEQALWIDSSAELANEGSAGKKSEIAR